MYGPFFCLIGTVPLAVFTVTYFFLVPGILAVTIEGACVILMGSVAFLYDIIHRPGILATRTYVWLTNVYAGKPDPTSMPDEGEIQFYTNLTFPRISELDRVFPEAIRKMSLEDMADYSDGITQRYVDTEWIARQISESLKSLDGPCPYRGVMAGGLGNAAYVAVYCSDERTREAAGSFISNWKENWTEDR